MASGRGGARRRKLTPVGATWMRGLYPPEMRMPEATISVLLFFETPPAAQVITEGFEKHLWPLYRFSSRVVDSCWVPVEGPMDRAYHITEHAVATEADIDAYAQGEMAKPLDHARPLWTVAILRARQGRSGVVIRMHHAISDGLGLLFAFLPLMACEDGEVLAKIPLPAMLTGRAAPRSNGGRTPTQGGARPRTPTLGFCSAIATNVWMFLKGVLSILVMAPDAALKLNAPLASRKPYLAFSGRHVLTRMPPVPTEAIKAVRSSHRCTFNDAIMAALSGAFRKYSIENLGDPLLQEGSKRPVECKCTMLLAMPRPIDPKDASVSLRNSILTPIFRLPVDEPTALGRLRKAVAMCTNLKSMAYIAGIRLTTRLVTSIAPVRLMRRITSEAISKCTCNVTNLPFPEVAVRFCGEEIREVQAIFVNNIPQISMVSYNGYLHWNMVSDPALIPNPVAFGQQFLAEFAALAKDTE